MANERIRRMARAEGVPLWKIAFRLGVSEPTLTRWLRVQLSEDRELRIAKIIEELAQEQRGGI